MPSSDGILEKRARKRREFRHLSDAQLVRLSKRIGDELDERGKRRWDATRALYGLSGADAREGTIDAQH